MPYQIIIVLVIAFVVVIGAIVFIFASIFGNAKRNSDFAQKAKSITVGMNIKDVFQIMNQQATSIEEDGDRVIVVWKEQQWLRGTLLIRSLKIVIDKDERVVSVVGENLDRSAYI